MCTQAKPTGHHHESTSVTLAEANRRVGADAVAVRGAARAPVIGVSALVIDDCARLVVNLPSLGEQAVDEVHVLARPSGRPSAETLVVWADAVEPVASKCEVCTRAHLPGGYEGGELRRAGARSRRDRAHPIPFRLKRENRPGYGSRPRHVTEECLVNRGNPALGRDAVVVGHREDDRACLCKCCVAGGGETEAFLPDVADLEPGGRPLGDDACSSIVFTLIDDDQLGGEKLAGQDRVETTSEPRRAVERGHGDADLIRLFLSYFFLQQGFPSGALARAWPTSSRVTLTLAPFQVSVSEGEEGGSAALSQLGLPEDAAWSATTGFGFESP